MHLFAKEFAPPDREALKHVLFDRIFNDWKDVLSPKIARSTLVVSGEHRNRVESQRRRAETVHDGRALLTAKMSAGIISCPLKNSGNWQSN
ncbi:hypothetical protein [Oxalobacter paraformigenes]|uniref:hypothetical protein n=1 Tax=Oxalobacter paraformigenes TaxID=556268 RepID=UPI0006848A5E|nr:hypothetical protein [Oxalobacter paraformigenes]